MLMTCILRKDSTEEFLHHLNRGQELQLFVEEALHIQMTPHIQMTLSEERFNRDEGLEVPGCGTAVIRRQGGTILTEL